MRPNLRVLMVLIVAIVLRGLSGSAYAMPVVAEPVTTGHYALADCPDHAGHDTPTAPMHHQPDDKVCQIACDLAVSPGLPATPLVARSPSPAGLNPTRNILAVGETPPPDHPPPIH